MRVGHLVLGAMVALVDVSPVLADVTLDKRTVQAGAEHRLLFTVPDEDEGRGAVTVGVVIELPEGFDVLECVLLVDWLCSVDRSRRTVDYQRQGPYRRADGDEVQVGAVVRAAPSAGRYPVTVVQHYATRREPVRWDGPAGGPRPAPVVEVIGSAPVTTTTAAPAGDPSQATGSTFEARGLVRQRVRKRSTELPVGAFVAAAILAAAAFGLWWRRRAAGRWRM